MAQKVTVQLVDDLDDSPITTGEGRTVEFAFDGSSYEIDLSNDNVDKFREAISDYIAAARKVSGRRTGGGSAPEVRPEARQLGRTRQDPRVGQGERVRGLVPWSYLDAGAGSVRSSALTLVAAGPG